MKPFLHKYAFGIKFCILHFAFCILFTLTSFAETTADVITCGNGSTTIEATTAGKPYLTVGYKNIFNAVSISLPDAKIDEVKEDEETGEITIKASTAKSKFTEKVIASRKDNAIIILLNSVSAPFTQKMKFSAAKRAMLLHAQASLQTATR